MYKLTCTKNKRTRHISSHEVDIFIPNTRCLQYQLLCSCQQVSSWLHQDQDVWLHPPQKTTRNVCAAVSARSFPRSPRLVVRSDPQWHRLRSPGCWRWKTLCWTPWRTRFCRWMALRVVWCRSTQVRALWTQVSCAASARALGWEAEAAAARPEVLPVWFWGSGSNTLETQAGVWDSEPWESVFIRTG